MQNYTVVAGPLRVPAGHVVRLTREQIEPRAYALEQGKGGVCHVLAPLEFKTGEMLGIEGDIPGHVAERVERGHKRVAPKADPAKPKGSGKSRPKPKASGNPPKKSPSPGETSPVGQGGTGGPSTDGPLSG
jgi:hypothetical protein